MLEVTNLSCGYGGADIIRAVRFSARRGELLCIAGPNGCGKSTLLKALVNVLPYRGSILIEGKEASSFSRKELARRTAFLGQTQEVYFPYTVRAAVALGRYAYASGAFHALSGDDERVIDEVLETLDLRAVAGRLISELSGGQLQRVYLGRALAQTPGIILLDEPTNHLDLKHQLDLLEFLRDWARFNQKTAIVVLHDLNLVQNYAGKVLLMYEGRIAADGCPAAALDGDELRRIYDTDVRGFMLKSLSRWQ